MRKIKTEKNERRAARRGKRKEKNENEEKGRNRKVEREIEMSRQRKNLCYFWQCIECSLRSDNQVPPMMIVALLPTSQDLITTFL